MSEDLYRKFLKRIMDVFFSSIAVIILSPIIVLVAALVRLKLGSPILFKQERAGLDEQIFEMYKFRSMTDEKDDDGRLLDDHLRMTKFGRMLRASSLDELPGLLNIVKGDMSIIGPRPLLKSYLPYYTKEERLRHSVRPGLSGLAQINGRNTTTWEKRFQYDIEYVKKISFKTDMAIMFKTILRVLKQSDTDEGKISEIPDFDEYRKDVSESY